MKIIKEKFRDASNMDDFSNACAHLRGELSASSGLQSAKYYDECNKNEDRRRKKRNREYEQKMREIREERKREIDLNYAKATFKDFCIIFFIAVVLVCIIVSVIRWAF